MTIITAVQISVFTVASLINIAATLFFAYKAATYLMEIHRRVSAISLLTDEIQIRVLHIDSALLELLKEVRSIELMKRGEPARKPNKKEK